MKPGKNTRREGMVAVIVAVALIAIMGIVALSLDGGMLMDKRREAQCAADAAAIAACDDMYSNWWVTQGLTDTTTVVSVTGVGSVTGSAKAAAKAVAAANGFVDGHNG